MIGQTVSHYRILEKLGAGGMGEVYRAEDANLNRQVAIKVLPDIFAADHERLARFEREAKLLASLNHPNIAGIHGLEQHEGNRFLVLELVEGQTLADRVYKGPLPVEEALQVCGQIAEGLEAAHEKGVIHRDLKPSNVMITPEGKVKLLDFGLARALRDQPAPPDPSVSPTITDGMTRPGVVLGTAAYMSPEQARGRTADKRADIWAFGCILFECLTGSRAFQGDTVTETMATILTKEPEWNLLPASTPRQIRDLLRHCLQKDPRLRLHEIADARIEVEEAAAQPESPSSATASLGFAPSAHWRSLLPWILCGALAFVVGMLLWRPSLQKDRDLRPLSQLNITLPESAPLFFRVGPSVAYNYGLAISRNGAFIVYLAARGSGSQLYLRAMDQTIAQPIPFTEDASDPFISPDGQWIGFFAGGEMKRVALQGGPPKTICSTPVNSRGASWGEDGTIVFALVGGGLWRVSADGGTPKEVTLLDQSRGEASHRLPKILPGGKAALFTIKSNNISSFDDAQIGVVQLGTGERRILTAGGTCAEYVPSGHIVYTRGNSLLAIRFDLSHLAVIGSPKPVLSGVMTDHVTGASIFAVSPSGVLVYAPGYQDPYESTLLWADRAGKCQQFADARSYADPRLSPDGQLLALKILAANDDVWIYEISRRTFSRLTFAGGNHFSPIWTPDGRRLLYSSDKTGRSNLYWKHADGSGAEERLTNSDYQQVATSMTPDSKIVAFSQDSPSGGRDIWTLSTQDKQQPQPFLRTQFDEYDAAFSPDGKWMAYVSNDSGREEVYVLAFPNQGRRWTISNGGGNHPVWHHDGNELFYRNGAKMMVVDVTTQPTFSAANPRLLFDLPQLVRQYDLTPDGRFLMIQGQSQGSLGTLNVVLNWSEELKRLVPTK